MTKKSAPSDAPGAGDELLDVELYLIGDAARLLRTSPSTIRNWLDGYSRGGSAYPPVVRPERTGSDVVTWGEFLELGYLRELRNRDSLQALRPFVARLRQALDTRYPLATAKVWISGKDIVATIEAELDLPDSLRMITVRPTGRVPLIAPLTPAAERVWRRLEFRSDFNPAVAWRPMGATSAVRLEPLRAFGAPNVGGIRTDRIIELHLAGEPTSEIASDFGLDPKAIEDAIEFELAAA